MNQWGWILVAGAIALAAAAAGWEIYKEIRKIGNDDDDNSD